MIYQRLSKRQTLAMTWWNRPRFRDCDGIICDGSVRSGKTLSMSVGFLLWATSEFDGNVFAICGKTIESLRRNIVHHLADWTSGILTITERRSENKLTITDGRHKNDFFIFGGRDESSASLIQGITLAGVLLDEVALMPRSFVEQACARCSVTGSKLWFNCNPEGPEHWFYKEWLLQAKERNILHLHFTMADNTSLSPGIRQRYERLYDGVFYRRFILGEWCLAMGLIYNLQDRSIVDTAPQNGRYFISIDYGTLNPFSAGLWCVDNDGHAVRIKEYYYSGRETNRHKTDAEYYQAVCELAEGHEIECIVVDPSAASFIEVLRRDGRFAVRQAQNAVVDGIRLVARFLQSGHIRIHKDCKDSLREFGLYCWDEKAADDRPLKTNDHAMDDIRYFASTILRRIVPMEE